MKNPGLHGHLNTFITIKTTGSNLRILREVKGMKTETKSME